MSLVKIGMLPTDVPYWVSPEFSGGGGGGYVYYNNNYEYGGGGGVFPVNYAPLEATASDTPKAENNCNCLTGTPVTINGVCKCQNDSMITANNTAKNETIILPANNTPLNNLINKAKQNPLLAGAAILAVILILKD